MSEIVTAPSAQPLAAFRSVQPALAPQRRRVQGRRPEFVPATDVRRRVRDLPGVVARDATVGSPPVIAAGAAFVGSGFKNVVCITLYNEPFELLRSTLSALLISVSGQSAARSCVVIIADGRNRIDPEIMRFFVELGVIGAGRSFFALGETVHLSRKPIDQVMTALGAAGCPPGEVDFAICVKSENRGKLHSHALFFQQICPVLEPELCYQLDAGTVVEASAVSKLVAYMDERPDVAAAASRILTPTPRGAASALSIWQYMDFVMQKAVTWPTEVASGYLSVIPGQFCVFRWSAVSAPSSDDDKTRPLDAYLRGLNAIAPLERVMFLAEDRVFGNEIVLAPDKSWRIGYCRAAEATTDACDTFGELLRQRRRWQNSALAVRLWLWGRLPAYLARRDKTLIDKARFGASMLWQGLLTASEVMSPAFVLLLAVAAAAGLVHAQNEAAALAIGGALLACGCLAWVTLADRPSRWRSALCLARDATAALAVVSLLALAYLSNPLSQAALMTAPVLLTAAVIAAAMPGQRWAALRSLPVYLLTDRPISLILYVYALANMHNVSWGTKGLTQDPRGHSAEERRLRRLRDIVAGSIIAVTAMLVAVGFEYPGLWVRSESSVIEVFTLIFLVVSSVAAAAWAGSALRSLAARLPGQSRKPLRILAGETRWAGREADQAFGAK